MGGYAQIRGRERWQGSPAGAGRVAAGGSIILEHDGGGDRSQTVAALRIVIPRLLDQGYRFGIP